MDGVNDQEQDSEPGLAATADEPQGRWRGLFPTLLFIASLLFMLTDRNEDVAVRTQHEEAVLALGYQLSNYSAWINGSATNFTLVRGFGSFLCRCS